MNPNPLHIETVNRVAIAANELSARIREALTPFVGKKIHKVTPYRSWTALGRAVVEPIAESFRAQARGGQTPLALGIDADSDAGPEGPGRSAARLRQSITGLHHLLHQQAVRPEPALCPVGHPETPEAAG